jgi:hypothetical protein
MPRKQRFKPSRKPKPIPTNEDAAMGHQETGPVAHNENAAIRESVQLPVADSPIERSAQSG